MQSIDEYFDYRDFLKDFYLEKKAKNPYYSYRVFASSVGIDTSYLAKVIKKTRHIANRSIAEFTQYCGLDERDTEYFEILVNFSKAKTDNQSHIYFDRLLSLKENSSYTLQEKQNEYYAKWYYSALRSVIEYFDFKGDFGLLGKQLNPSIGSREAKKGIQLLESLGLIQQDANGRYHQTKASITTGPKWNKEAIQTFQERTIDLALEALERHPKDMRDISTITMTVNAEQFDEIKKRIKLFRAALIQYINQGVNPDRVYHMNIQLFPLTKIPKGEK